jgi:hypothetical protein
MLPFIQCHHVWGLAETGGWRNLEASVAPVSAARADGAGAEETDEGRAAQTIPESASEIVRNLEEGMRVPFGKTLHLTLSLTEWFLLSEEHRSALSEI